MLHTFADKETGKCLVFARTKRGTERIAECLNRKGFSRRHDSCDRSQSQRTSALTGFQQGRFRVLVATDLASRGIHVQDIAHVINYDCRKWRKTSSIASGAPAATAAMVWLRPSM